MFYYYGFSLFTIIKTKNRPAGRFFYVSVEIMIAIKNIIKPKFIKYFGGISCPVKALIFFCIGGISKAPAPTKKANEV